MRFSSQVIEWLQPPAAGRSPAARAAGGVALLLLLWVMLPLSRIPAGPAEALGSGASRSPEAGRGSSDVPDKTRHDYDGSCLSEGCHGQLVDRPRVHKPAAVQACQLCHTQEGEPKEHRFTFARKEKELCALCHSTARPRTLQHEPFAESTCTECHDAHGGAGEHLLIGKTTAKTCEKCHELPTVSVGHDPVTKGECSSCHEPHQSAAGHLLRSEETKLCSSCHEEQAAVIAGASHVHEPVSEGCLACHAAHGGEHEGLLSETPGPFCLTCHEEILADPETAHSIHSVVQKDKWCSSCHVTHAGSHEKLLVDSESKVCFRCHNRAIEVRPDRTISSIQKQLASARSIHDPIAKGKCTPCHQPHFSTHRTLLRENFPETLYTRFSEDAYEMCFSCHDRHNYTDKHATGTAFRDGNTNLHFVHVNQEKGRVCIICHEPHGSAGVKLMRQSFPFGDEGWQLPMNYTPTETGGSCERSCHKAYSYDNTRGAGAEGGGPARPSGDGSREPDTD